MLYTLNENLFKQAVKLTCKELNITQDQLKDLLTQQLHNLFDSIDIIDEDESLVTYAREDVYDSVLDALLGLPDYMELRTKSIRATNGILNFCLDKNFKPKSWEDLSLKLTPAKFISLRNVARKSYLVLSKFYKDRGIFWGEYEKKKKRVSDSKVIKWKNF